MSNPMPHELDAVRDAAALANVRHRASLPKAEQEPIEPAQLTRGDLQRMSPDEIVTAKASGRLDSLLGRC